MLYATFANLAPQRFDSDREKGTWVIETQCPGTPPNRGVIEGNVRCEEADTLTRVGVDELPNASPQDGANKDDRIENDQLSGMRPSRGDAAA
jgi:hypothetical protein